MTTIKAIALIATTLLTASAGRAEVFTIGGFTFDEANCAQTAAVVGGPKNLKIQNSRFGKYSSAYLQDASIRSNEFAGFDRSASLGWRLQPSRVPSTKANFHAKSVALSNEQESSRSAIELSWGENGIRNVPGIDFVIYAADSPEGFAVSVLKNGAAEFSRAKYQVADTYDAAHEASAFAFDIRDFSVADGEMVRAIRIQSVFHGSSSMGGDKVDAVSGQGMLILASDKGYSQGFPLLRKANERGAAKQSPTANIIYAAALHDVEPLEKVANSLPPGFSAMGGYTFNPNNLIKKVFIVEGPANLKVRTSGLFGRNIGNAHRSGASNKANDLTIDRSATIGQLLRNSGGTGRKRGGAMHVMFPDVESSPPTPNVDRAAIELNWDDAALRNKPGNDFIVYEVEHWEGFAVAVQKAGSGQWTHYRYQYTNSYDTAHVVNAIAFDLSRFGLKENEMITAIRIRNLFNSKASAGADRVDDASGQGNVLYPNDPKYRSGFPLLMKAGGKEFPSDLLDADIVYVVSLHDVEPADSKVAVRP